jgi:UTP--glucose-1-phosphate uridylyltransferase
MINTCLFPAAGYGTRFLPATKAVPKEMLPILNKPLLQYGVEEALFAGIKNMAIVTGRGKRAIEDHFDDSYELELQLKGTQKEHYLDEIQNVIDKASFTYIRQRQMLGLGHAILTGEPLVGNQPFAVILADDLCDCRDDGVTSQLIQMYKKFKCSIIAIEEVSFSQVGNYGVISGDLIDGMTDAYRVTNMLEKPNPNDLIDYVSNGDILNNSSKFNAIVGRYILTPDIFDILRKNQLTNDGELQITDALLYQAKKGRVIAHKFTGNRFDCGSVKGFLDATNHFAKNQGIF